MLSLSRSGSVVMLMLYGLLLAAQRQDSLRRQAEASAAAGARDSTMVG